jgi:hypothetical protein
VWDSGNLTTNMLAVTNGTYSKMSVGTATFAANGGITGTNNTLSSVTLTNAVAVGNFAPTNGLAQISLTNQVETAAQTFAAGNAVGTNVYLGASSHQEQSLAIIFNDGQAVTNYLLASGGVLGWNRSDDTTFHAFARGTDSNGIFSVISLGGSNVTDWSQVGNGNSVTTITNDTTATAGTVLHTGANYGIGNASEPTIWSDTYGNVVTSTAVQWAVATNSAFSTVTNISGVAVIQVGVDLDKVTNDAAQATFPNIAPGKVLSIHTNGTSSLTNDLLFALTNSVNADTLIVGPGSWSYTGQEVGVDSRTNLTVVGVGKPLLQFVSTNQNLNLGIVHFTTNKNLFISGMRFRSEVAATYNTNSNAYAFLASVGSNLVFKECQFQLDVKRIPYSPAADKAFVALSTNVAVFDSAIGLLNIGGNTETNLQGYFVANHDGTNCSYNNVRFYGTRMNQFQAGYNAVFRGCSSVPLYDAVSGQLDGTGQSSFSQGITLLPLGGAENHALFLPGTPTLSREPFPPDSASSQQGLPLLGNFTTNLNNSGSFTVNSLAPAFTSTANLYLNIVAPAASIAGVYSYSGAGEGWLAGIDGDGGGGYGVFSPKPYSYMIRDGQSGSVTFSISKTVGNVFSPYGINLGPPFSSDTGIIKNVATNLLLWINGTTTNHLYFNSGSL